MSTIFKSTFCGIIFCMMSFNSFSQKTALNISYLEKTDTDSYRNERCKLDVLYFTEEKDRPVVIFFHGGGLTSGEKYFPNYYRQLKYVEVAVNYRLSPNAKCPSYIEDAAEAVSWVWKNIDSYGGDKHKIIVTGNSAGAYLAAMLALDSTYLLNKKVNPNDIWIYFLESAQMTTHIAVLEEQNIHENSDTKIVDKYAPLYHKKYIEPYIVLTTGDRDLERAGRFEQNTMMYEYLDSIGVKVLYWEIPNENHVTVGPVARKKFVEVLKDNSFFNLFSFCPSIEQKSSNLILDDTVNLYSLDGKQIQITGTRYGYKPGSIYVYKSSGKSRKFLQTL